MCEPFRKYENSFRGIISEIISAKSSLHMYPELIKNPNGEYLSDTDINAKHSIDHLSEAIIQCQKAEKTYNKLCDEIKGIIFKMYDERITYKEIYAKLESLVYRDMFSGDPL